MKTIKSKSAQPKSEQMKKKQHDIPSALNMSVEKPRQSDIALNTAYVFMYGKLRHKQFLALNLRYLARTIHAQRKAGLR